MLTVEVHLGHLENTARHKTFHRELEQMRHVLSVNGLILVAAVIGLGALAQSAPAGAAEEAEFTISIKDHKFDPAEIKVPASKAIKLTVNNWKTVRTASSTGGVRKPPSRRGECHRRQGERHHPPEAAEEGHLQVRR